MADLQITPAACREALVQRALREWERGVECRRDADRITRYFAEVGWQWHLDEHSGGMFDEDVRRSTIHLEYCGIFVGFCGLYLGNHLDEDQCLPIRLRPALAEYVLPSTYRINSPYHWSRARALAPEKLAPADAKRGDIVTVETSGGKLYGDHYAIVVSRDGDVLETVEANASGELGDGTQGRGVVRRTRDISKVRRVYRLQGRHFENALTGQSIEEVGDA